MAKQAGMGDRLFVAGFDISGDIGSLGKIQGGNSPLDVTGIDKSAMERVGGRRDGSIDFTAYFNPAANQGHDRLKLLPTTDVILTYCRGTTLGNPAAALVAKQVNYDGKREDSGALTFDVSAVANGFGLEWGTQLTAGRRVDSAPANGTGVDLGVGSTAFGLQAYLQVFAFVGTSVTIKLQSSSDNGGGDPYSDVAGGAFSTVTGITSERIATSAVQTIEQWLRVVTTGTFSSADFAVMAVRNDSAVSF
jgi:hypothetical protein